MVVNVFVDGDVIWVYFVDSSSTLVHRVVSGIAHFEGTRPARHCALQVEPLSELADGGVSGEDPGEAGQFSGVEPSTPCVEGLLILFPIELGFGERGEVSG